MLSRDALERDDKVFQRPLFRRSLGRFAVHQVVETLAVLEEVIHSRTDAEDAEREDPDTDHSDDAGHFALLEPAPNAEARGDDVNDQNGSRQLPRGNRRPERSVGAGDENEPILRQADLEENNLIHVAKVLHNTTVGAVRVHRRDRDPGTDGEDHAENHGDAPKPRKVPLDRCAAVGSCERRLC